jgi:hypothetical protein
LHAIPASIRLLACVNIETSDTSWDTGELVNLFPVCSANQSIVVGSAAARNQGRWEGGVRTSSEIKGGRRVGAESTKT